jgi:DNA-binding transcriptional regulator YhcF (GntR family)
MASKKDELEVQIKRINKALAELETVTNSADRSEQLKQIKDLTKAAEDYATQNNIVGDDLNKQLDTIKTTNTELTAMLLVNKGIVKTFKEMSKESRNFAVSTSEWFTKGEELAKQYLSVSKNIGISDQRTRTLSRSFNATVGEALKLGISLDGVREIFDTFAESSGRSRILSEEEGENIAKVAAGTGLYASEASKLAEQFDLMGVSSEKMVGFLNESIGSSREMGLNSNKVIKTLQGNMKAMNG